MAEMLLINPRGRRRAKKSKRRDNPTPAQRRARARFAAMARARRAPASRAPAARASNPVGRSRRRRRSNPVVAYRRRRRSNPIGGVSMTGIVGMLREAAVQGAGAVAMDIGTGYIVRMLPASMQPTPGQIGVGTVVKAALTAALGQLLNRPTRGLSRKAATGSLAVQAYQIASSFVPASIPVGRVGYASPARVVNMSNRINPNRVGMLAPPGATQLLNAYATPGASMLLNRSRSRAESEGAVR